MIKGIKQRRKKPAPDCSKCKGDGAVMGFRPSEWSNPTPYVDCECLHWQPHTIGEITFCLRVAVNELASYHGKGHNRALTVSGKSTNYEGRAAIEQYAFAMSCDGDIREAAVARANEHMANMVHTGYVCCTWQDIDPETYDHDEWEIDEPSLFINPEDTTPSSTREDWADIFLEHLEPALSERFNKNNDGDWTPAESVIRTVVHKGGGDGPWPGHDPLHSLEVFISGMSTHCNKIRAGSPIYLEFFENQWTLLVWSDINREDPTHRIDMSGAMESRRG